MRLTSDIYKQHLGKSGTHKMGKKKCTLHCDVTLAKAATLDHKSDDAQRQQEEEGEVRGGEK